MKIMSHRAALFIFRGIRYTMSCIHVSIFAHRWVFMVTPDPLLVRLVAASGLAYQLTRDKDEWPTKMAQGAAPSQVLSRTARRDRLFPKEFRRQGTLHTAAPQNSDQQER